ncbi:CHAT domain-containing protein [bacterium]|nr:CHAT domain-containing protein [bacterium]
MQPDQDLYRSVNCFLNQNYAACVTLINDLMDGASPAPHQLGQMLVISLQRLRRMEEYPGLGEYLLNQLEEGAWEQTLLRLTLGLDDELFALQTKKDCLKCLKIAGKNETMRCQTHYYTGARFLTAGFTVEAHSEFEDCLKIAAPCLEYEFAKSEARPVMNRANKDYVLSNTSLSHPVNTEVVLESNDARRELFSLHFQARQLLEAGHYKRAIEIAEEALQLAVKRFGKQHHEYARSLNNLAAIHLKLRNGDAAERLIREALRANNEAGVEWHPDVAKSMLSLAQVRRTVGDFKESIQLCRKAAEIFAATQGILHANYALALNQLGQLYGDIGDYETAAPILIQATNTFHTAFNEFHLDYLTARGNLASVYSAVGNYAAAGPIYREAVEKIEIMGGENHPALVSFLNNLAVTETKLGNYEQAERDSLKSMELLERINPDNRYERALRLLNLSGVYLDQGDFAAAEISLQEVHRSLKNDPAGAVSEAFAASLRHLARICVVTDRSSEAIQYFDEAARVDNYMLASLFSVVSEKQRLAYLDKIRTDFYIHLSFVLQHARQIQSAVQSAFRIVLQRKALAAEAFAVQRDAILHGLYVDLKPELELLYGLRRQLAELLIARFETDEPDKLWQEAHLLRAQIEDLESKLAEQIPEMNLELRFRKADQQAVVSAIPQNCILVEFVRTMVFNFFAIRGRGDVELLPSRYLAFVLHAGQPDRTEMVDLGEASVIDELIAEFRKAMAGEGRGLGTVPLLDPSGLTAGSKLRELIFDPIKKALDSAKAIWIAPDGDLARLPFEVLPLDDGRYLIDAYLFNYLTVSREIVRFGSKSGRKPMPPVVIADPDFDLSETDAAEVDTSIPERRQSRDLSHALFDRLSGTRLEGERIAQRLGVHPWLDASALEARLRACHSPLILHLATHGFFLEDQNVGEENLTRGLGALLQSERHDGISVLQTAGRENPLLRSGLALSAANTWLRNGRPPSEAEDGILTAEDVTSMDLLDTELTVLSACETGLGAIHAGEGVMGLRRSFVLAGVKTLVMSLWKVPDQETQQLMEEFYRGILRGDGRAEALRKAQLSLKRQCPDPFYWGAFICQGDPSPLFNVRIGNLGEHHG